MDYEVVVTIGLKGKLLVVTLPSNLKGLSLNDFEGKATIEPIEYKK